MNVRKICFFVLLALSLLLSVCTACDSETEEPKQTIAPSGEIDLTNMNLYQQRDNLQFVADENAKLSVYVDAEKLEDGSFAFDDGQDWCVLLETSFGNYPIFPRQYVQLGDVSCAVFNDYVDNSEVSHILVTEQQAAGYKIFDCVFDADAKVFEITSVYNASGINFITKTAQ